MKRENTCTRYFGYTEALCVACSNVLVMQFNEKFKPTNMQETVTANAHQSPLTVQFEFMYKCFFKNRGVKKALLNVPDGSGFTSYQTLYDHT